MIPHIAAKALDLFTSGAFRPSLALPVLRVFPCAQWWEATDGHALIRIALDKRFRDDLPPGIYTPAEPELWRRYAGTPEKWRAPDISPGPLVPARDWPNTDFVWPPVHEAAAPSTGLAREQVARLVALSRLLGPRKDACLAVALGKDALGAGWWRPNVKSEHNILHCEVVVMPMRIDGDSLRRTTWDPK